MVKTIYVELGAGIKRPDDFAGAVTSPGVFAECNVLHTYWRDRIASRRLNL